MHTASKKKKKVKSKKKSSFTSIKKQKFDKLPNCLKDVFVSLHKAAGSAVEEYQLNWSWEMLWAILF